ncbi:helix-turn-helix domain-containing protein [Oceanospirillum beijerinckii]|uniref:helix-turn-helix domain-containing protein n=1 Tax=Oceanospirillum beijerinckii TaxID=64976 RepID=UPI0004865851|nr:helix-turn-helix transcriptional regulator [Oceanospirillum beijerinckii]
MNFDGTLLARNIRYLMLLKGIKSETELANRAGMNQPTVTRILGAAGEPRISNVMKIAAVLEVDYWRLISNDLENQGSSASAQSSDITMSVEQIDLLREILVRIELIAERDHRSITAQQKAQITAAALATALTEGLKAEDLNDTMLRSALNASIQNSPPLSPA